MKLAFIGGTGPEGKGLAYRFGLAGEQVIIGSRSAERAAEAAAELQDRLGAGADAVGAFPNGEAAARADVVLITVPFSAQSTTLPALADACAGKVVVSTVVPLAFVGRLALVDSVPEGSAAEQAQALLPRSTVVGAFQNLSAHTLLAGDVSMEMDVLVCGDAAAAKSMVMSLAERIRGVRALDAGPLAACRMVEAVTAMLLNLNRRYKAHAGLRIVGIDG